MFARSRLMWKGCKTDLKVVAFITILVAVIPAVAILKIILANWRLIMKPEIIGIIILSLVLSLTGCAAFKDVTSKLLPSTKDEAIRIVINETMDEIIDGNPRVQRQVIETVGDIRSYVNAEPEMQANKVVEFIRGQIPWNEMSSRNRDVADVLLNRLKLEIHEAHEEGSVDNKAEVRIKTFLDMIENAAYEADIDQVVLA